MASTRKSKTVNKRISKVNEDFLDKDGATGNKNKNRKRKLSDMLGSQWSKDELGRFYEAYRKYGKDWKKVAVAVRNRSVEMVEALYNMNRAYLSLPEGTASVIGLIAMMTDHYNVMEGSESEHESNDIPGVSRKPQKRGRGKSQVTSSKGMDTNAPDLLNSPSIASNLGCLSLLKKKRSGGTQPRAVGKRTPRVPVSYYGKHDREQFVPSNKRVSKSDLDAHDDEAAHGVVLVLAEALQRGSSPQVSQAPVRRTELIRPSSARNRTQKQIGSKLEGNLERREAGNGYYTRDSSYMMDIEGVGNVEVNKRGKKFHGKKLKNQDVENNQFDDVREACSGTEEELNISSVKQKGEDEVRDSKYDWSSPRGQRKRSRPLLFEDEISAIDALQTLADLSLKLPPASTVESESSVQFNEEKRPSAIADKSSIPEISSTSRQRDKSKVLGAKERAQHSISGFNRSATKNAKLGKDSASHDCSVPDAKKPSSQTITKVPKQTRKSVETMLQSQRNEAPTNSLLGEPQNTEVLPEDGKKLAVNAKQVGAPDFLLKQGKLFGPSDRSSPIADALIPGTATSSVGLSVNQVNLPTKLRSRRKTAVQKALVHKEVNAPEKISKHSLDSRTLDVKEKLSRCLSSQMLRRWCAYEWFYSAIDYPWFARKEFVEYMNHVGLGKVSTLTRVEWGVIRSSLGKPRRLSQQFLREEKEKLEHYRESVRTHYTELKAGIRDGLPTDLARPLSVGQRVIACHPRTRDFYDGSVLTVYHNRCRIQFDRAELGVEFVMDIDCMPLNPLENIPEALKRQNTTADRSCENINEPRLSNPSKDWKTGGYIADSISQISSPHPLNTLLMQAKGDTVDGISQAKAAANEICNAQKEAYTQPCTLAQIQAREADVRALSELTRALEKKEALVRELRRMNDEVYQNQKDGDSSLKDCDPFKRQYATVFIQLKETNDQVSSALLCLRQQNTYQGNSTPPLLKPKVGSGAPVETIDEVDQSAFLSQESGSHVTEILERTGSRAQMLVSTAVQTLSSLEEGEDVLLSLNEAVGAINHHNATDSGISTLISSISADRVNVSFPQNDSANSSQPTNAATANGTDHDNILDKIEVYTPKALISSCVATMLMVLRCLDRQHPPAEIAQIIDSAFTRMQPYCSPSLSVYREIEMCMGIMRNQILARTPT